MWDSVKLKMLMQMNRSIFIFPSENESFDPNANFTAKPERCPARIALSTSLRQRSASATASDQAVRLLPRNQAKESIPHSQKGALCRPAADRALPGLYGDNKELQRGRMPRLHLQAGGPPWLCALTLPPLLGSVETAVQGCQTQAHQSRLEFGGAVVHPRPSGPLAMALGPCTPSPRTCHPPKY